MNFFVSPSLKLLSEKMPCPLYLVGGAVRDYILYGSASLDVDICAPILVEDFMKIALSVGFSIVAEFKKTGTVKIKLGDEEFEFTSFRFEEYEKGGFHSPKNVTFTSDIMLDATRRDFKCNAIYYDVKNDKIIDVLGGIKDLKNKRLDTVVSPKIVFSHDGLRLFRLCRFSAKHNLIPTKNVIKTAKKFRGLINDISPERIKDELIKILSEDSTSTYRGCRLLFKIGLLEELFKIKPQNFAFKNKNSLVKAISKTNKELRLAFISIIFADTPYKAIENLKLLKISAKEIKNLSGVINLFFAFYKGDNIALKIKNEVIDNFFAFNDFISLVKITVAKSKNANRWNLVLRDYISVYNKIIANKTPITVKNLALSGKDLINMGLDKKDVNVALNKLLIACQNNPSLNEKEKLIDFLSHLNSNE